MKNSEPKVKPLGDRVIVRLDDARVKSDVIVIPDNHKDHNLPGIGEIVAVSDECSESVLLPGVRVIVNKYSGTEVAKLGPNHKAFLVKDVEAILG